MQKSLQSVRRSETAKFAKRYKKDKRGTWRDKSTGKYIKAHKAEGMKKSRLTRAYKSAKKKMFDERTTSGQEILRREGFSEEFIKYHGTRLLRNIRLEVEGTQRRAWYWTNRKDSQGQKLWEQRRYTAKGKYSVIRTAPQRSAMRSIRMRGYWTNIHLYAAHQGLSIREARAYYRAHKIEFESYRLMVEEGESPIILERCAVCGREYLDKDLTTCPECKRNVCKRCYNKKSKACHDCLEANPYK
jgi:hypothetical protein